MRRFLAAAALGATFLAGCSSAPVQKSPPVDTNEVFRTVAMDFGKAKVDVEIAADPASRATGLMNRTKLGSDRGMLFLFPDAAPRAFYMKNTLIPLSIAYMRKTDRGFEVAEIVDMKPCGKQDPCPIYPSRSQDVSAALEVNKGWFVQHSISPGDIASVAGGPHPVS